MTSRKPTPQATLDQLRRRAADERLKHRELEMDADAARLEVKQASKRHRRRVRRRGPACRYRCPQAEQAAMAKVKELQHRLAGTRLHRASVSESCSCQSAPLAACARMSASGIGNTSSPI